MPLNTQKWEIKYPKDWEGKKYPENLALCSDLFGLSGKNIIKGLYSYKEIEESLKELPCSFLYLNAYKF